MIAPPRHVQAVLDRFSKVRKTSNGWQALCPAHEDKTPSLSVSVGDTGHVLLHCHRGCSLEEILSAVALEHRDLFPVAHSGAQGSSQKRATPRTPPRPTNGAPGRAGKQIVAKYPYADAEGELLFEVVRYEPKDFRQRRPDGRGGWTWNMNGTPRVLYRLAGLLAADPGAWVFVCEGEKDVDALADVGLTATCNPGGAGKWGKLADDSALHGRRVAIIPDRDPPGRRHAQDVAARLYGKAAEVRVLDLGDGESFEGKDVSDWIAWFGSRESGALARDLVKLAEAAATWTGEDWPELTPLREEAGEPPRFPAEALPPWLRHMVEGVAEATQTPPELAGSVGLAVLALAGGGKALVAPQPGWTEPLNLFFAVALPPGCRKSAVFSAMIGPLVAWEKRERERMVPELERAKTAREIIEKRLSNLKRKAAEGDASAEREALKLSEEMAVTSLPTSPRVFASDATPEAVARLLSEQEGRLGIFSAEGGEMIAVAAGRYSKNDATNMEVFLKGHAGDALRVDRANRERAPIILDHPALTVALCVQPSVLAAAWEHDEFDNRGLLARFLYALPKNPLGTRNVGPAAIPHTVSRSYKNAVLALLNLLKVEDEHGNLRRLAVTDEAHGLLLDLMRRLEPELGPGGKYEYMTGWAGKLAGAVARIAGGLHLAGDPEAVAPWDKRITGDTMRAALALGEFYAAHAERAYRTFGGTPEARTAARVLDWIKRNCLSTFPERDCYRVLGIRSRDLIEPLALLSETGHVRPACDVEDESEGQPGRKPSRTWEVNPAVYSGSVNSVTCHKGSGQ